MGPQGRMWWKESDMMDKIIYLWLVKTLEFIEGIFIVWYCMSRCRILSLTTNEWFWAMLGFKLDDLFAVSQYLLLVSDENGFTNGDPCHLPNSAGSLPLRWKIPVHLKGKWLLTTHRNKKNYPPKIHETVPVFSQSILKPRSLRKSRHCFMVWRHCSAMVHCPGSSQALIA